MQVLFLFFIFCKSKAAGLDSISAKLLRHCLDLVAESLTLILNLSLLSGTVPQEWNSIA